MKQIKIYSNSDLNKKYILDIKPMVVIFSSEFNYYIPSDFLPESVEKIIFGYKEKIFENESNTDNYSIENMIDGEEIFTDENSFSKFNSNSINNFELNTNIRWIIFPQDSTFNQEIKSLPINLEFLSLGNSYVKSLEKLPKSLKYLIFLSINCYSDKLILNCISSISNMLEYFGIKTSNDSVMDKLPKSTKYIDLETYRYGNIVIKNNKALDFIDYDLDTLKLKCVYDSKLKNLPNCLKKLSIYDLCTFETLYNLPNTLEFLEISFHKKIYNNDDNEQFKYFSNLPNKLKFLKIYSNISGYCELGPKLNLDNLPDCLTKLCISSYLYDGIFNNLPTNLEELICENCIVTDSNNCSDIEISEFNFFNNLPRNLKYLTVSFYYFFSDKNNFNKYSDKQLILTNLPDNLEYIKISNKIEYKLDIKYKKTYFDEHFNKIEFV